MRTKVWLIIAVALIFVGGAIFAGAMTMLDWNFNHLSTDEYDTNEHTIDEAFININIITDTADITFVPCEQSTSTVTCYEPQNMAHSVTVKDQTLVIEVIDNRKWYEHIGFYSQSPKITVCIPQGEYHTLSIESDTGDVVIPTGYQFDSMNIAEDTGAVTNRASVSGKIKIQTSTGAIHVENVTAGTIDLSASTGKIIVSNTICEEDLTVNVSTGKSELTEVTCKNVLSDGDTGSISLKHVIAEESFSIKRDTGNVRFENSDAAEIFVETDTGDISGTLLSDKVFFAQSDTGKVNVPKSTSGGKCELSTDTGNIEIVLTQAASPTF